jgi:hypothetical protein
MSFSLLVKAGPRPAVWPKHIRRGFRDVELHLTPLAVSPAEEDDCKSSIPEVCRFAAIGMSPLTGCMNKDRLLYFGCGPDLRSSKRRFAPRVRHDTASCLSKNVTKVTVSCLFGRGPSDEGGGSEALALPSFLGRTEDE